MMKKITILVVLSLILAAALAACGNKDSANPSPSASASASPSPGAAAGSSASPAPAAGAAAAEITLTATNWQYDQKEYRVKKGQPVKLTLVNKDGNHGAKIKELNVDLNNSNKSVTVTPDKTGQFEIRCSIPCGTGHLNMVSKLIVE
jgi:cytochrome c oxidase subunit II